MRNTCVGAQGVEQACGCETGTIVGYVAYENIREHLLHVSDGTICESASSYFWSHTLSSRHRRFDLQVAGSALLTYTTDHRQMHLAQRVLLLLQAKG